MLLEIGREGEAGKPHEWSGERALVIGRGRNAEMMIQDPLLSRRHCQLELSGDAVVVHDLGSANGTFVNGIQSTRAAIMAGDVVTFGRSWLRIVPEVGQVEIGGACPSVDGHVTTRRFDQRAARTSPERHYDAPSEGGEVYPRIEGYEVFGTIGKGSFGTVFRARNRSSGRIVAIKVIPTGASAKQESVARFLREIEATGQLDHPNLVAVHGAGEAPHFAYLVMEHVDGETLAKMIQRDGKIETPRSLEIGRQIASALEHAFSRGFVHRDVKPENILVDQGGTAKLCDFGLVKNLAASSGANLTRPGQGFGSLAYMPPEQVRDAAKADQRADVYSLGATIYNLLTGRRPFSGPVNKSLLRRILEEYPEPILSIAPEIPKEAVRLVERCLMKDPAQRFQSPRELREAIEACLKIAATGLEPAIAGAARATPPATAVVGAGTETGPAPPSPAPVGAATERAGGAAPEAAAVGTGPGVEARGADFLGAAETGGYPPVSAVAGAASVVGAASVSGPRIGAAQGAVSPGAIAGGSIGGAPHWGGGTIPPSGRPRSVSDSDAFDDFASDLEPIGTDSNPVLKLPLPGGRVRASAAPPASPAAAPVPAAPAAAPPLTAPAPLAHTPSPVLIPAEQLSPAQDPVAALFPFDDATRRTLTPPFLAFGRTGLPRRIEPAPPEGASRPSADTWESAAPAAAARPSATDTADVPAPLVRAAAAAPTDKERPVADDTISARPPPPPEAPPDEKKEGLLGLISRRLFKRRGGKAALLLALSLAPALAVAALA